MFGELVFSINNSISTELALHSETSLMAAYLPQHCHITILVDEVLEYPGSLHELIRERMSTLYLDIDGLGRG